MDQHETVTLTTSFPESTFLYRLTRPRCRVGDAPEYAIEWGENEVALPSGAAELVVRVPYLGFPRAGWAAMKLTGDLRRVYYVAPILPLGRGVLSEQEIDPSIAASKVGRFNLVLMLVLGVMAVAVELWTS